MFQVASYSHNFRAEFVLAIRLFQYCVKHPAHSVVIDFVTSVKFYLRRREKYEARHWTYIVILLFIPLCPACKVKICYKML